MIIVGRSFRVREAKVKKKRPRSEFYCRAVFGVPLESAYSKALYLRVPIK
jgi:hypothetical protein